MMQIYVEFLKRDAFEVGETCTIAQLRKDIGERYGILMFMNDYRLTCNDAVLEDEKAITDYSISKEATIIMTNIIFDDPDFRALSRTMIMPPMDSEHQRKADERQRRISKLNGMLEAAFRKQQALKLQAEQIALQLSSAEESAKDLLRQYDELRYAEIRDRDQREAVETVRAKHAKTEKHIGLLVGQRRALDAHIRGLGFDIIMIENDLANMESALARMESQ